MCRSRMTRSGSTSGSMARTLRGSISVTTFRYPARARTATSSATLAGSSSMTRSLASANCPSRESGGTGCSRHCGWTSLSVIDRLPFVVIMQLAPLPGRRSGELTGQGINHSFERGTAAVPSAPTRTRRSAAKLKGPLARRTMWLPGVGVAKGYSDESGHCCACGVAEGGSNVNGARTVGLADRTSS